MYNSLCIITKNYCHHASCHFTSMTELPRAQFGTIALLMKHWWVSAEARRMAINVLNMVQARLVQPNIEIRNQKTFIIYPIGVDIRKKSTRGKQTGSKALGRYSLAYAWARRRACIHKQTHVPITYYVREQISANMYIYVRNTSLNIKSGKIDIYIYIYDSGLKTQNSLYNIKVI